MDTLNDELGNLYAQALLVVARVDGEVNPEEASRLRELVAARSPVAIDDEAGFFHKVTPEELRVAAKGVDARELGRALVTDAVALASADGDLNGAEAQTILRFAHALGCTQSDVASVTHELDQWISVLG